MVAPAELIAIESVLFLLFSAASFWLAHRALWKPE
jgi:hypothetical protein